MAKRRVAVSPLERVMRRAQNGVSALWEMVEQITDKMECPNCGRRSLVIEDPKMTFGIVIFCERSTCSWKPYNRLIK